MTDIYDLEKLGYTVAVAASGVWFVSGYGLSTYVAGTDSDMVASLADPALHAARVDSYENPAPVPAPRPSQLVAAIGALKTLDQTKPATIGDVVSALKAIVS